MHRTVVPAIIALLAASATAPAQVNPHPDTTTGHLAGQRVIIPAYRNRIVGVFDALTGAPVEGAEVSDVMGGTKSLTSSTGNVSLFFLPEGTSLVRVRKVGYEAQTFFVAVVPQDSSTITIAFFRLTDLPPVVTTDSSPIYRSPALRGFMERMKTGFGHYITEAELRKHDDMQLADLLSSRVPGINIIRVGGRRAYATTTRVPGCIQVVLDGVPLASLPDVQNKRISGVDLSQFSVETMGAVEFYAGWSTAPVEY